MTGIPRAPLILGLAGLLPFIWGVATMIVPSLGDWIREALGPRFVGPYVQVFYGAIILSFMSGVLWGFATKSGKWLHYVLSVVPALWAFFMTGGGAAQSANALAVGFVGLLAMDRLFSRDGLTPAWWMRLRIMLTVVVVACLLWGASL